MESDNCVVGQSEVIDFGLHTGRKVAFMRIARLLLHIGWGLPIAFVAFMLAQQPFRFTDDFSRYPDGSFGEPNWEVTEIGFEVRGGKLVAEIPTGRAYAVLKKAPLAYALTVEATLTVHRAVSHDWKIAGIGISLDERNYWHLALVESPDAQGKGHFAELHEMLDGVWLAEGMEGTRLTTEADTGGFEWQYGRPYRLRLTLTKKHIVGEIFEVRNQPRSNNGVAPKEPDGTLLYRRICRFDNKAVTLGRPMLDCGGFAASFDDVRVEVSEVAKETPKPKTFPPFPVRKSPIAVRSKATGFFRTERINGIWWLIDPNGNPALSIGTDHVSYFVHWCEKLGYAPYHRNVAQKYGSEEAWAKEAVRRLLSWNFNVLGANNSIKARYQGLAHTEFISFTDFTNTADIVPRVHWTGFPDVFDLRFERFCDLRAKQRCAPNRDDPWLLGYFLDNELEWWGKSGRPWGMAEEAWKKPPDHACKQALVRILREFYRGDISTFNADFGTNFGSFDDLLKSQTPAQPLTEHGQKALMAFVRDAAERYFRITAQAIKKHDPNHLNLGCRFAWDAPEPAWEMAGKYCDIVTVNLYPRIDMERGVVLGVEEHLRKRYEICKKPIIVTEWSFPALDAKDSEGKPLPCKHGAGMRVDTQEQKARCYAIFQRMLFSLPFVVGSHYFMWVDEPALGISSTFPEDSNYGLVNEADEPYPELTTMATKVNAQMFALHAGQTAELSAVNKGTYILVSNNGKVAATFTLAVWLNGKRTDERISLKPKATRIIAPKRNRVHFPMFSAIYLRVICDPEDNVPERNESDNVAEMVIPPTQTPKFEPPSSTTPPSGLTLGYRPIGIVIYNPTPNPLRQVSVELTDRRIRTFLESAERSPISVCGMRLGAVFANIWQVTEHGLTQTPFVIASQHDWLDTIALQIPDLPPFNAVTFWLGYAPMPKLAGEWQPPATVQRTDKGYEIKTDRLRFIKDETDGDAFDHIYLRSDWQSENSDWIELGSFTPLIWQVVAGQNLWVRPDKVEKIEPKEVGPARLIVDIIFCKEQGAEGKGQVITEVGKSGVFAPLKAEPQPFRCAYRFTLFPDQPFFLAQFLWVENTGKQAWQWRGYYHYTPSKIGGDERDDGVGGAGVPNYWLLFASWRDQNLRVHYGVIPLQEDERLSIWFWKDEGGNQHPDCHRRLDLTLKPGERWQPKEPEPIVAIFGVRETDENPRPWSDLVQTLRAWAKVKVKVF